jgi:hypothetical protein
MSQPAFSADNRSRTMKRHTARQCFHTAGSSLTFLVRRLDVFGNIVTHKIMDGRISSDKLNPIRENDAT